MQISLAYILIVAEVMLILLGISITLGVFLLRKPTVADIDNKKTDNQIPESSEDAEDELDAIDLGESYIDFLEQAMERNEKKKTQQETIEDDSDNEEKNNNQEDDSTSSPAPDEKQSHLLNIREQFLLMEKSAAENSEHENHFWDSVYDGMKNLLNKFSITENIISETSSADGNSDQAKEKIFYIETQGKKVDGEVNKLKDIIYEQENALSSMKKAMKDAEAEHPEESESLQALKEQINAIERQLNDSKMCMEVLEMENNRLQEEVDKISELDLSTNDNQTDGNEPLIDIDEIKGMVEEQKRKIEELIKTIDSLEISSTDTEKLKLTIHDFAHSSQEMMGCIAILEEENERLKANEENASNTIDNVEDNTKETQDNSGVDALNSTISNLEEEAIKKDVAFAQLQDEFSSMETEYLAMYEAMHGDNS